MRGGGRWTRGDGMQAIPGLARQRGTVTRARKAARPSYARQGSGAGSFVAGARMALLAGGTGFFAGEVDELDFFKVALTAVDLDAIRGTKTAGKCRYY